MREVYKIHTLEDNHKYIEIDSIICSNIKYLLLAQDVNQSNICIRKIIDKNNNQYYDSLTSKEFDDVYEKFILKNKNLFE